MDAGMLEESGQGFQQKEAVTAGGKGNYRDGEVRCYNCEYFEDPDVCKKGVNGGKVDAEGGCDLFEMLKDGEDSDPNGEADESPEMQDSEPFEND